MHGEPAAVLLWLYGRLAAIASRTERVRLGTATLLPVLRRPVTGSQTLAPLDVLSGGRLIVGIGAGFPGRFGRPLHAWSGVPWERRFTRLDETVALWRRLWTSPEGGGSFHGTLLHVDDLPPGLTPHRPGGPPVWPGGATDSALRRAGRHYDGWLPYPPTTGEYATGLAAVRAAADGRDVTPALFVSVAVTDTVEQGTARLAEYAETTYGLPLAQLAGIQALTAGPQEVVAEALAGYVGAGVRHLVVRIAAATLPEQRDQLARIHDVGRS